MASLRLLIGRLIDLGLTVAILVTLPITAPYLAWRTFLHPLCEREEL